MPKNATPKYPGLNVPTSAQGELGLFLEALKEHAEMLVGDRGDPLDRVVTVGELEKAGIVTTHVKQRVAEIRKLDESTTTNVTNVTQGAGTPGVPLPVPVSGIMEINGDRGDAAGVVDLELDDLSDVDMTGVQTDDMLIKSATDYIPIPKVDVVDGGNF